MANVYARMERFIPGVTRHLALPHSRPNSYSQALLQAVIQSIRIPHCRTVCHRFGSMSRSCFYGKLPRGLNGHKLEPLSRPSGTLSWND